MNPQGYVTMFWWVHWRFSLRESAPSAQFPYTPFRYVALTTNMPALFEAGSSFLPPFPYLPVSQFTKERHISHLSQIIIHCPGDKKNLLSVPKRQRNYKPEVSFCVFIFYLWVLGAKPGISKGYVGPCWPILVYCREVGQILWQFVFNHTLSHLEQQTYPQLCTWNTHLQLGLYKNRPEYVKDRTTPKS